MSVNSSKAFVLVPKDRCVLLLKQQGETAKQKVKISDGGRSHSTANKESRYLLGQTKAPVQEPINSSEHVKSDKTSQWIYY